MHLGAAVEIEDAHERPWATVLRVAHESGVAWFKACGPVQSFEPRLTVGLARRWPGRVADVIAHDLERAWLLLADAGTPVGVYGNPPEAWLVALPPYAELQRGEAVHAEDHLRLGGPGLRLENPPGRGDNPLRGEPPPGG